MTSPIDDTVDDLIARAALRLRGGALREQPLSRRLFLAGAAAGAATLGLTACGGGGNSTAQAPSGSAGFPITVAGKEGTATIPAPPQRVIALGLQRDAETVLALGVPPIAMPENPNAPTGIMPWTEAALTDPRPDLLNITDGLPFEKIVALQPDLILATDNYELAEVYARLAQIAPTVSYLEGVNSDTWQQRAELIGKVLGRGEQATKVIADTENKVTQATADNPAFAGKTFSLSNAFGGEIYTVLADDASAVFLEQLGLRLSPKVKALPESTPGRARLSLESLGALDADVMIVTSQTDEDRNIVESSPLFAQLNAVKNGTYIPMDFLVSVAMAFPSPLSIPYALDGMVPAVSRVLT
ncbi:MAG: iron-siderophore ABC transporter substrate-binding protein [Pseudonocardiaceae bacterium]